MGHHFTDSARCAAVINRSPERAPQTVSRGCPEHASILWIASLHCLRSTERRGYRSEVWVGAAERYASATEGWHKKLQRQRQRGARAAAGRADEVVLAHDRLAFLPISSRSDFSADPDETKIALHMSSKMVRILATVTMSKLHPEKLQALALASFQIL